MMEKEPLLTLLYDTQPLHNTKVTHITVVQYVWLLLSNAVLLALHFKQIKS